MNRLLLLRHAQAVPWAAGRTDFDRPLTTHGREQSAAVGTFLADGPPVNRVLCSSSVRTRETLAGLGLTCPVTFTDAIYDASTDQLRAELADLVEESVLMIGHAPGIPSLAHDLSGPDSLPEPKRLIASRFPTATLVVVEIDQPWADVAAGTGADGRLVTARLG